MFPYLQNSMLIFFFFCSFFFLFFCVDEFVSVFNFFFLFVLVI